MYKLLRVIYAMTIKPTNIFLKRIHMIIHQNILVVDTNGRTACFIVFTYYHDFFDKKELPSKFSVCMYPVKDAIMKIPLYVQLQYSFTQNQIKNVEHPEKRGLLS